LNEAGRNDPCRCGSGRKYKKCCLDKDLARKDVAGKSVLDRISQQDQVPSEPPKEKTKIRPPRVTAHLGRWFGLERRDEILRLAATSKGKWKDDSGRGQFAGWVHPPGQMPVHVEGLWLPPDLDGVCSRCGRKRCIHLAALASMLEGASPAGRSEPKEEQHPCSIRLFLSRWRVTPPGRRSFTTDGACLFFGYGPREVEESKHADTLTWDGDDGPIVCPRDLGAEAGARALLDELGWSRTEFSSVRHTRENRVEDFLDFIEFQAPRLREAGWDVEVSESLDLRVVEVDSWKGTWTREPDGWFGMRLGIEFEGGHADLFDLCKQILSGSDLESVLARLRDGKSLTVRATRGYLRLPPERMLPILSAMAFLLHGDEKAVRVPALLAGRLADMGLGENSWTGLGALREIRSRLESVQAPAPAGLPESVRATLRPYQEAGLAWVQWLSGNGFGGILADDMGLGKTLQTIAHIACERRDGKLDRPALIVCPTSLSTNWAEEFARFCPDLRVVVLHGADRRDRRDDAETADVAITTYPLLSRDEEWLATRRWHLLVLDEAQTLKNSRAVARKVVARLPARHRLALSGTPMENHLGELWSLFDLVQPGLLGTERHFSRNIRPRIEKLGDEFLRARLRGVVSPFILRRTKEDVARELPEKTEIVQMVELRGRQRDLYETVRSAQDVRLRTIFSEKGWETSAIQVLDALLRLRQTCCDPRLLPPEVGKGCEESAKLEWVAENLPEMVEEGRRVLVFSQFTSFLDLVEPILAGAGIPFLRLDGSTRERGHLVKEFQVGGAKVFLLSLKAGGTGLNLTAADTVVFLDPWWNPAVEAQAADRAHRIGQEKKVFVYRLVARGTVEERILSLQERKSQLATSILEGGGAASVKFTPQELAELLRPLE
jgi:superfamily II DNA or RNA helicase